MKNQTEIAHQVASQLRPLEVRSMINTEAKYRFVADIMAAAREGRFTHADAAPIIAKLRRNAELSAEADGICIEAHALMSDLAKRLELEPRGYGDWSQSEYTAEIEQLPVPRRVA